jgi:hypothetical protein
VTVRSVRSFAVEAVGRQSYGSPKRRTEELAAVQGWKGDYPWLQRAFDEIGPGAKTASEGWRARIEDDLETTLDFKVRPDGTATVWCGLSGYDFRHDPTPKELFEGLADAYRREVKRVGGAYPTRTGQWKGSTAAVAHSTSSPDANAPVTVATRAGTVQLPPAARQALLEEIKRRGGGEALVQAFETADESVPVSLDRDGTIVVFDALWALVESAGGDDRIDPQLALLRVRLRDEIAGGPAATGP